MPPGLGGSAGARKWFNYTYTEAIQSHWGNSLRGALLHGVAFHHGLNIFNTLENVCRNRAFCKVVCSLWGAWIKFCTMLEVACKLFYSSWGEFNQKSICGRALPINFLIFKEVKKRHGARAAKLFPLARPIKMTNFCFCAACGVGRSWAPLGRS